MIRFRALSCEEDWLWFKERTSVIRCEDTIGIVAYDDSGIKAVCVADSFTVDACCVHFAIDSPIVIRRGFFAEISRHLFVVCRRERIFGLVPANNSKALKLDEHIGFTEAARIPNGFKKGVDTVVLVMEKENCRWLAEEHREAA